MLKYRFVLISLLILVDDISVSRIHCFLKY